MTSGQKVSVSLLLSVILFSAFAVYAFTGLFSVIETRFYEPVVVRGYADRLAAVEEEERKYTQALVSRFEAYTRLPAVQSYLERTADAEQVKSRGDATGELFMQTPALKGIRIIDRNGKNVHFSTYDGDIKTATATSVAYQNYGELGELAFSALSPPSAASGATDTADYAIVRDGDRDRLLYVLPLYSLAGVECAKAVFYCAPEDLNRFLLGRKVISVHEGATLVSGNTFTLSATGAASDGTVAASATGAESADTPAVPDAGAESDGTVTASATGAESADTPTASDAGAEIADTPTASDTGAANDGTAAASATGAASDGTAVASDTGAESADTPAVFDAGANSDGTAAASATGAANSDTSTASAAGAASDGTAAASDAGAVSDGTPTASATGTASADTPAASDAGAAIDDKQAASAPVARRSLARNARTLATESGAAVYAAGLVFALPTVGREMLKPLIAEKLSLVARAGETDGGVSVTPLVASESADWVLISHRIADGSYLCWLCGADELLFSLPVRVLLLALVFITLYLVIFLLFSLRHDDMVVIQAKIKRFQLAFLTEYLDAHADDAQLSLAIASRRQDVDRELKRSLGRRAVAHGAEVDALLEKNWSEILTALGANRAPAPAATDTAAIKRMLEEVLSSGRVKLSAEPLPLVPPASATPQPAVVAKDAADADDVEELEEVADSDEVAELEEVAVVEEVADDGDVAELEAVAAVEEVADADDVTELEEAVAVEEVADGDEVAELEEVAAVEEFADGGDVAELEEAAAEEEVADSDDVAELEEAVAVEEVADADDVTELEENTADDVSAVDDGAEEYQAEILHPASNGSDIVGIAKPVTTDSAAAPVTNAVATEPATASDAVSAPVSIDATDSAAASAFGAVVTEPATAPDAVSASVASPATDSIAAPASGATVAHSRLASSAESARAKPAKAARPMSQAEAVTDLIASMAALKSLSEEELLAEVGVQELVSAPSPVAPDLADREPTAPARTETARQTEVAEAFAEELRRIEALDSAENATRKYVAVNKVRDLVDSMTALEHIIASSAEQKPDVASEPAGATMADNAVAAEDAPASDGVADGGVALAVSTEVPASDAVAGGDAALAVPAEAPASVSAVDYGAALAASDEAPAPIDVPPAAEAFAGTADTAPASDGAASGFDEPMAIQLPSEGGGAADALESPVEFHAYAPDFSVLDAQEPADGLETPVGTESPDADAPLPVVELSSRGQGRRFLFADFGASLGALTELEDADDGDVIIADDSGVFRIADDVPAATVRVDAALQALVNSVIH